MVVLFINKNCAGLFYSSFVPIKIQPARRLNAQSAPHYRRQNYKHQDQAQELYIRLQHTLLLLEKELE